MLTQTQLIERYGDPGVGREDFDPAWRKANTVTRQGKNALPGVPPRFYFECHRLAVGRIAAAFGAAQIACPDYKIATAASFVFRHMRHDVRAPLSWHSWGVAVDIDAPKNGGVSFPVGKEPKPWSAAWRKLWPNGLPQAFVEAFEANGFEWGGRWRGYVDPMHFQVRE